MHTSTVVLLVVFQMCFAVESMTVKDTSAPVTFGNRPLDYLSDFLNAPVIWNGTDAETNKLHIYNLRGPGIQVQVFGQRSGKISTHSNQARTLVEFHNVSELSFDGVLEQMIMDFSALTHCEIHLGPSEHSAHSFFLESQQSSLQVRAPQIARLEIIGTEATLKLSPWNSEMHLILKSGISTLEMPSEVHLGALTLVHVQIRTPECYYPNIDEL
jgi:hypothetical protein